MPAVFLVLLQALQLRIWFMLNNDNCYYAIYVCMYYTYLLHVPSV